MPLILRYSRFGPRHFRCHEHPKSPVFLHWCRTNAVLDLRCAKCRKLLTIVEVKTIAVDQGIWRMESPYGESEPVPAKVLDHVALGLIN